MLELELKGVDNSISQLLTELLNSDKDVEFAAYKSSPAADSQHQLVVKTKKGDPIDLVIEKLEQIREQVADFRKQFKDASK